MNYKCGFGSHSFPVGLQQSLTLSTSTLEPTLTIPVVLSVRDSDLIAGVQWLAGYDPKRRTKEAL
jgi:hypothetical protein